MQLTLYTGNTNADQMTRQALQQWSAQHNGVDWLCESIHAHPDIAVRLAITQLPALIADDEVLAQGHPGDWLTEAFLSALVVRADTN